MLICSDCGNPLGKSAFGLTCRTCGVVLRSAPNSAAQSTPLLPQDETSSPLRKGKGVLRAVIGAGLLAFILACVVVQVIVAAEYAR